MVHLEDKVHMVRSLVGAIGVPAAIDLLIDITNEGTFNKGQANRVLVAEDVNVAQLIASAAARDWMHNRR